MPLSLIFDRKEKKPVEGLTILPVDLDGNGRINDEEKFYGFLENIINQLEETPTKEINNIPIEYINLSVDKNSANPEAIKFLIWVIEHGETNLHEFGYLKPDSKAKRNDFFLTFAAKNIKK